MILLWLRRAEFRSGLDVCQRLPQMQTGRWSFSLGVGEQRQWDAMQAVGYRNGCATAMQALQPGQLRQTLDFDF